MIGKLWRAARGMKSFSPQTMCPGTECAKPAESPSMEWRRREDGSCGWKGKRGIEVFVGWDGMARMFRSGMSAAGRRGEARSQAAPEAKANEEKNPCFGRRAGKEERINDADIEHQRSPPTQLPLFI